MRLIIASLMLITSVACTTTTDQSLLVYDNADTLSDEEVFQKLEKDLSDCEVNPQVQGALKANPCMVSRGWSSGEVQ